ncbi:MAG: LPS-assembly protein LptD [Acidobacteriaceae bacterium]|nr:LPS-assembly protein LptD [Acidobacteriaceae bacterium]MBV9441270.1 LPS-assembly protein LptD [Acidobacteriaceae bacterium]
MIATALGSVPAAAQTSHGPAKANLPPADEIWYHSVTEDSNGPMRYLHGAAKIELSDVSISADDIEFNSDTNWVIAKGHVSLEHFVTGDKLNADHGEYNLKTQDGKFYGVNGTSPAKIITSPGVLTTTNPFYFQAKWAERIKDRYILHQGFLTDCKIPKPWWTFEAPVFDVIPGDRAIARHTVLRLKRFPILYLPYFYRPLGKNPRQSGFLTPNIGHSSVYGYIFGVGYYWAINRSYDMTGIAEYFSARGPAFRYDFRGKPNEVSDFNFNLYSVVDTKGAPGQPQIKEGGTEFELTGRTEVLGFTGRLDYNYLSSYLFRQAFSYSYTSAVSSEIYSLGYLQRHFQDDSYTLNIIAQRDQLFETITYPSLGQAPNQVVIQKLPEVQFSARDHTLADGPIPVWWSLQSTGGLLNRQEPTGTVQNYGPPQAVLNTDVLGRMDVTPRVATEFSFKGFSLNPSFSFEGTDYTNSYATNTTTYTPQTSCNGYPTCPPTPTINAVLANANVFRHDADIALDFRPPALEKIYTPPAWMHIGAKLKHVIEADATYEYVTGINEFQRLIHFDSTDIVSNTNQLTLSLTNRLYRKDKKGNVNEVFTWRIAQARYFDPTFGGAVLPNQRNVVLSAIELTPIAFLDGPRTYSPVVSTMSVSPYAFLSFDWRADYDPLRKKFVDHQVGANVRYSKYFASVNDTAITTNPLLVPQANQISFGGGYGSANRKGWNAAATVYYDLLLDRRLFNFFQVSYNTDCCGFSMQLRQFNLGIRNENQYLFSFSLANIGTFGSLQKQARIF